MRALHGGDSVAWGTVTGCWQALQDNPWVWLSVQAALRFVPPPEAPAPEAPGPFSFADPGRIESVLGSAGFKSIGVTPHAITTHWGFEDSLEGNVRSLIQIGPVSRLLQGQSAEVCEQVVNAVVEEMREFYDGNALSLPGATWLVTATA